MTKEQINEALAPLLQMSDRQFDDKAKALLTDIINDSTSSNEQIATDMLFLLDSLVCWSWSSGFEIMVINVTIQSFCKANSIDEEALRNDPNRRQPLKEAELM